MISRGDFDRIVGRLRTLGFADEDIRWAESLKPPALACDFAMEVVFVICNSGMKFSVANGIYLRLTRVLGLASASTVFKHRGKAAAIDHIWQNRAKLFTEYKAAPDKLAYLETLPWIGPITKYHLAKNFGLDLAKPDVHLQRLADLHRTTPQELCANLARLSGYRIATVDTLIWRACATGVLNSRTGQIRMT